MQYYGMSNGCVTGACVKTKHWLPFAAQELNPFAHNPIANEPNLQFILLKSFFLQQVL